MSAVEGWKLPGEGDGGDPDAGVGVPWWLAEGLSGLSGAVAGLEGVVLAGLSGGELGAVLAGLEQVARQLDAVLIDVAGQVDRDGLFGPDGFRSAASMLAYHGRLSLAHAKRRVAMARAAAVVPAFGAAHAAGEVSTDQLGCVARLAANPRVAPLLGACEEVLVAAARQMSYPQFARFCVGVEQRLDPDGPNPKGAGRRSASVVRDPDGSMLLVGSFTPEQAVIIAAVLDAYCEAERAADVDEARAHKTAVGDPSPICDADLARSSGQRRADAIERIFRIAGGFEPPPPGPADTGESEDEAEVDLEAEPDSDAQTHGDDTDSDNDGDRDVEGDGDGGSPRCGCHHRAGDAGAWPKPRVTLNLTMPLADYLAELTRLHSDPPDPPDPPDPADVVARLAAPGGHIGTIDGQPLPTWVVAAYSLDAHVRRVVIDTDGTVIDLGRRRRLFTGAVRDAIMATNPRCLWAGCDLPACWCQGDHLHPWNRGGTTTPGNGAPLCGFHNRHKTTGYTIARQPDGTYHTIRPDGTRV